MVEKTTVTITPRKIKLRIKFNRKCAKPIQGKLQNTPERH